jgi:hypothetical protein
LGLRLLDVRFDGAIANANQDDGADAEANRWGGRLSGNPRNGWARRNDQSRASDDFLKTPAHLIRAFSAR